MNRAYVVIGIITFIFLAVFLTVLSFNIYGLLSRPATEKLFNCLEDCTGPRSQYIITVYKGVHTESDCAALKGEFIQPNIFTDQYFCKVK